MQNPAITSIGTRPGVLLFDTFLTHGNTTRHASLLIFSGVNGDDSADLLTMMNVIWNNLYPTFQDESLPEDGGGQEKLKEEIARLEAHPAEKGA